MVAYAGGEHPAGSVVRCTYIAIPQAPRTLAVVLSKPSWMWGAEMGANEASRVMGSCLGGRGRWWVDGWVGGGCCDGLGVAGGVARACRRGRQQQPPAPAGAPLSAAIAKPLLPPLLVPPPQAGVVCGNEAVWTVEDSDGPAALLGMDLVRYGPVPPPRSPLLLPPGQTPSPACAAALPLHAVPARTHGQCGGAPRRDLAGAGWGWSGAGARQRRWRS